MTRPSSERLPVIVIGNASTALSVQRLTARLGYPCFAACAADSWAARTRYYRPLPSTRLGRRWRGQLGKAGWAHLRALDFERAILIPTADDAALWLSQLPADIADRYHTCVAGTEALRDLQDKRRFARRVTALGISHPESIPVSNGVDLYQLAFDGKADYFFKPHDSQSFWSKHGFKALRFDNKEAASRAWEQYDLATTGVIVQEYVSGGPDQHYFIDGFIDASGKVRAKLARRRVRMHPLDFGNSSCCKSVAFDEVESAWDGLAKLLSAVSYRGIFSAEFKRDARTGVFKILEVNTRPWIYVQFAADCDVNMIDLYIRDAQKAPLGEFLTYRTERQCVNVWDDFNAIRSMSTHTRPGIGAVLKCWLGAFKMLFDARDVRPSLSFLCMLVTRTLMKITGTRSSAMPSPGEKAPSA